MRRQAALSGDLPLLLRVYPGLKPWDLDRMTYREIDVLYEHAITLLEGNDG